MFKKKIQKLYFSYLFSSQELIRPCMLKKDRSKHMIFQLLIVTVSLYFLTPYTSLKYIRDKKGVFVTYVVRCNNSFMKSSFQRHTAKHIIIYISTYLISLSTLVWSIIFDYLFFFFDLFILVRGRYCLQGGFNSPGRQVARS